MTDKKVVVGLVVVALIAIGSYFVKTEVKVPSFGADSGPTHLIAQEFLGGSVRGLVNSTSTTLATYTMVAADLANPRQGAFYDTYLHLKTGAVATTTNTFPATSTLAHVLPRAGMRTDICFVVATSTGGAGMIIAEGTGWKFVVASSTRIQTASGLAPASAVSRTITGGQPTCGMIVRERVFNDSAGFVETATSTIPGDLVLILTPTYPAE